MKKQKFEQLKNTLDKISINLESVAGQLLLNKIDPDIAQNFVSDMVSYVKEIQEEMHKDYIHVNMQATLENKIALINKDVAKVNKYIYNLLSDALQR